jgi:3-oxoacyl-[acyl-carrier protein] reductase
MAASHIDVMQSKIPKGRFGGIDEVTAPVCWLASEEASFTTGAVFDISGGRATYQRLSAGGCCLVGDMLAC